jgi:hypothetical protein
MGAQSEMWYLVSSYVRGKYGVSSTIDVVMTTKKDKKAIYPDPKSDNRYTLHVYCNDILIAESDEQPGYNKSIWSGEEWANFILTLKHV